MSLLEDVMAEEDLFADPTDFDDNAEEGGAGEAEEAKDGEEEKKVEPKKRIIRNPQPKLNADRLRGPRGLSTLQKVFEDVRFKGKNHEKEYLDKVMWKLEHWCHRLYPKLQYDECLYRIEKLGHKKLVRTYMGKIRQGLVDLDEIPNEEIVENVQDVLPLEDEFDNLLDQQIAQIRQEPTQPTPAELTDEQKERIRKNKEAARELLKSKRLAQELQFQEYENIDTEVVPNEQVGDFLPPEDEINELLNQPILQKPLEPVELTDEQQERMRKNQEAAKERLKARRLAQQMQPENIDNKEIHQDLDTSHEINTSLVVTSTSHVPEDGTNEINSSPIASTNGIDSEICVHETNEEMDISPAVDVSEENNVEEMQITPAEEIPASEVPEFVPNCDE